MRYLHVALLLVCAGVLPAAGQVPRLISHNGYLDTLGTPVEGIRPMTFRLFQDSLGGTEVWSEAFGAVSVTKGVYFVTLDVSSVTFDKTYWLQTEVGAVIFPARTRFTSVPYALSIGLPFSANIASPANGWSITNNGGNALVGTSISSNAVVGTSTAGMGVRGNSTTGNGVYGTSSTEPGVYGNSTDHVGVYGYSLNDGGIYGTNGTNSNFGYLGGPNYGAYGKHNATGNFGYLGGSSYGVYGSASSNGGFAGYFDGTVATKILQINGGSDVAEPFAVEGDEEIEPGTVLVIDEHHPGQLTMSSETYDNKVAGIVSGAGGIKPGLTLQQDGLTSGRTLIALAGRVYCKADARSAAIEPGDLLTTSSTPGYAMKATDRGRAPGAIIGKAMSSLKEGKGLILVLVNLQ